MEYQWYPGHMTKARRMMEENIKLIDLIIELADARIPASSRNPDIDRLGQNKFRLILLNKADLADPDKTALWMKYFQEKGCLATAVDARDRKGMQAIQKAVDAACREKTQRDRKRGILNRPVRAMVAGIPNVGKSTFINSFAGRSSAKTGNRPGVTKGKQWIRLNKQVELLDTPGILWPKFDDSRTGRRLAMIGSMNDEILDLEALALDCIRFLQGAYPGMLEAKYGSCQEDGDALRCLEHIARARGCIAKGGLPDLAKGAGLLLEDFRNGRIGRVTLELPPSLQGTEQGEKENEKEKGSRS